MDGTTINTSNNKTKTNKKKSKKTNKQLVPFISVCTPTFNRRPFFPSLIKCFQNQTYPKERMEWIIIDDGTDPIKDLVEHVPQVKYFYFDKQLLLGNKRNIMHSKCSGDIIIYMDDDDYYPRERVSHAVESLVANPEFLIAGSSEMHIYFNHLDKLYQCGPYGKNHSTAATFAFRRELLLTTWYDDKKALAEETQFLKNYTIPLLQLNVLKTILVLSHCHNSFDKKILLTMPEESKIIQSPYHVNDFIKEEEIKNFYIRDLDNILKTYKWGEPNHKPELLKQMEEMRENREKRKEEYKQSIETQRNSIYKNQQSEFKDMSEMKAHYEKMLESKNCLINELLKKIKTLTTEVQNMNKTI